MEKVLRCGVTRSQGTAAGATTRFLLDQDIHPSTQETRAVTTWGLKLQLQMLSCSNHTPRPSYCSRKVHKSNKRPAPQISQLLLTLAQNKTSRPTHTYKHRELLSSLCLSNPRPSLEEVCKHQSGVWFCYLAPELKSDLYISSLWSVLWKSQPRTLKCTSIIKLSGFETVQTRCTPAPPTHRREYQAAGDEQCKLQERYPGRAKRKLCPWLVSCSVHRSKK